MMIITNEVKMMEGRSYNEQTYEPTHKVIAEKHWFENNLFTQPLNILIVGQPSSGVSSLGWSILEEQMRQGNRKPFTHINYDHKVKYFITYDIEHIKEDFKPVYINNSVIHSNLLTLDKKNDLKFLLSNIKKRNNTYIISTHQTHFISNDMISLFDVIIIKKLHEYEDNSFLKKYKQICPHNIDEYIIIKSPEKNIDDLSNIKYIQFKQPSWYKKYIEERHSVQIKEPITNLSYMIKESV